MKFKKKEGKKTFKHEIGTIEKFPAYFLEWKQKQKQTSHK